MAQGVVELESGFVHEGDGVVRLGEGDRIVAFSGDANELTAVGQGLVPVAGHHAHDIEAEDGGEDLNVVSDLASEFGGALEAGDGFGLAGAASQGKGTAEGELQGELEARAFLRGGEGGRGAGPD